VLLTMLFVGWFRRPKAMTVHSFPTPGLAAPLLWEGVVAPNGAASRSHTISSNVDDDTDAVSIAVEGVPATISAVPGQQEPPPEPNPQLFQ
jgi:hypothetical protein